ncbi:MAG: ABC transporter permease [Ardenticatenaceae bacterium]|nr:ABC transporter permease [Ardenticatenaceae bacterium]
MSQIAPAIWVEFLKARRSKMPLLTFLGFLLVPFIGGFFMIVLKDPDLARSLGLISTKAQIMAGTADWPTFLGLLAQAAAVGGLILFGFIGSWVFGREYSDRTVKDLLALPTPRFSLVLAKFTVVVAWSALLTGVIYLIGLGVGAAVGLPATSADVFWQGTRTVIITTGLTILLVTPVAFFASAGRGYLPPMGFAILTVILAQIVAAAGWGEYFPWSVPALNAGMAGPAYAQLGVFSYLIVVLTSLLGTIATFGWWTFADQV